MRGVAERGGGPGGDEEFVELVVNGEAATVPAGTSVARLLERRDLDPRAVAVERNGEIVPRPGYGETLLRDGDRLEVVRFVQGG